MLLIFFYAMCIWLLPSVVGCCSDLLLRLGFLPCWLGLVVIFGCQSNLLLVGFVIFVFLFLLWVYQSIVPVSSVGGGGWCLLDVAGGHCCCSRLLLLIALYCLYLYSISFYCFCELFRLEVFNVCQLLISSLWRMFSADFHWTITKEKCDEMAEPLFSNK